MDKKYTKIVTHYEACLEKHGDTHLGVDWPNQDDVYKRYQVMLDIVKFDASDQPATLLDFGCGTAHLLEYAQKSGHDNLIYSGLDISPRFVAVAQKKFPENQFYCVDVLEDKTALPNFDYIVMNGVFTEKRELSFDEMWAYFTRMIDTVYQKCNKGFAFNVMSKNVDWERDDLFHVSYDLLSGYLCKNLTRHHIIRNDYGLYEYTVYVLKKE